MDPFTQAALGAVTARSVAPADMAKGVLAAGAVLGAAPDIDILFSIGGDFFDNLIHHRGYTHSLIVLVAVGPLSGHWLWRRFGGGRRWRATASLLVGRRHLGLAFPSAFGLADALRHSVAAAADGSTLRGQRHADRRSAVFLDSVRRAVGGRCTRNAAPPQGRRFGGFGAELRLLGLWLAAKPDCGAAGGGAVCGRCAVPKQQEAPGLRWATTTNCAPFPPSCSVHYRRIVIRSEDAVRVGYLSTWAPCAIEWGRRRRPATSASAKSCGAPERGASSTGSAWAGPIHSSSTGPTALRPCSPTCATAPPWTPRRASSPLAHHSTPGRGCWPAPLGLGAARTHGTSI